MITLEMIDELRKRVNVSYEDAKEALENSNGDILEAIIYLEKNKKVRTEEVEKTTGKEGDTVSSVLVNIIKWCKKWIKKGNENHLVITKGEKVIVNISLTVVALLMVVGWFAVIPVLVLAIFTGHKIKFQGEDIEKTSVNEISEKMENAANNIVEELKK